MDARRITLAGKAIPVRGNDIDTDRIIPARYLRCVTFDEVGKHAFEDDRLQLTAQGKTHAFDLPQFQDATVLLVNKNFGCGSSREHAPQAIMRWGKGIKAIIGESFAEIFFGNCVSLGIPCAVADEATIQTLMDAAEANPATVFTLNVDKSTVEFNGRSLAVEIPEGPRQQFLEGRWDTMFELLEAKDQTVLTAAKLPYFNQWK